MNLKIAVSALVLIAGHSAFSHEEKVGVPVNLSSLTIEKPDCSPDLHKGSSPADQVVANAPLLPFEPYVEEMLKHYATNLGVRGFDNSVYPPTLENLALGRKYGFFWWYTQGYFVSSREAALKHAAQFSKQSQDRFGVGLYFIADEAELGVAHSEMGTAVPEDKLRKIFERGAIEIDYFALDGTVLKEPRVRDIPGAELMRRTNFELAKMVFVTGTPRSYNSNYLNINGWHTGKFRGITDHKEYLASKHFRELVDLYQRLHALGFRVVFNPPDRNIIDEAKQILINTQRVKTVVNDEGAKEQRVLGTQINRHKLFGLGRLESDDAFWALLLNPARHVVGGEAGLIHLMEGETTLYDPDRAEEAGLKLTKASELAMALEIQLAVSQGLMYSSSGPMVSNYSADNHTRVVPLPEALKILAQAKQDRSVAINGTVWDPFENHEVLSDTFNKLAKTGVQGGLADGKFLGSFPPVNPATAVLALSAKIITEKIIPSNEPAKIKPGTENWPKPVYMSQKKTEQVVTPSPLVPTELRIQFVEHFKEAKAVAETSKAISDHTLFVQLSPGVELPEGTPGQILEYVLAKDKFPKLADQKQRKAPEGSRVQFVMSFKVKELPDSKLDASDLRYYEHTMVADRLNLGRFPAARWANDGTKTILIPGWTYQQAN